VSIDILLKHRATVQRSVDTFVKGSPSKAWTVVADSVNAPLPVLYSKDSVELDPTWSATQKAEASQLGTLFTRPDAPIEPGDHVSLVRPVLGVYEVLPDPSPVLTLSGVSHREYKVRSL
jgi:hypothetical protein